MERKTEEDLCSNENTQVGGHRKIEKLKRKWSDVIQQDVKETCVQREGASDWKTWKMKAQCTDPNRENMKIFDIALRNACINLSGDVQPCM